MVDPLYQVCQLDIIGSITGPQPANHARTIIGASVLAHLTFAFEPSDLKPDRAVFSIYGRRRTGSNAADE